MIGVIARREMLDMARDGRFRVAAALVVGLLLLALAIGWRDFRDVYRQHQQAEAAEREHWLTQGTKNPHSAAHYGVYAFTPRSPLSIVDRGTERFTGVAVWLEAHRQNDLLYKPAQDGGALQRFAELTVAGVLQLLLPLLIVLAAFGAFAGERETGTLRQVMSMGVRPMHVASGKVLGLASALGVLLVPAAAIGLAALAMTLEKGAVAASGARVALWIGVYAAYFLVVLAVVLAVSAWARSSRAALVVSIGLWMAVCLIAPKAASNLARRAVPTPSLFAFTKATEDDMRNGIDGHGTQLQRTQALQADLLRRYRVSRVQDLPINFMGYMLNEGERYGNLVYDRHYGRLWEAFERQNQMLQRLGALSPLLAVRSLSMGLSGTDFAHQRAFAFAAEQYRRRLMQQMNNDVMLHGKQAADAPYVRGPELWAQVEPFRYTAPSLGWVLQQQRTSIAVLLGWLVAAFTLLWASVRRLRVE